MTTLTKNKTITFESIMKNFKNFVSTRDTRPELQYVYFDGTHLVATDSHRLLKVNSTYISDLPKNEPFLYDPKKNEFIDVIKYNYPNTNRLIPNHYNTLIKLDNNIKEIETVAKESKPILKGEKNTPIRFEFADSITKVIAINKETEKLIKRQLNLYM